MTLEITTLPEGVHVVDYSVAEDANTLDPDTYQGGTGQISFVTSPWSGAKLMHRTLASAFDRTRGSFVAEITDVDNGPDAATFTADNILGRFNAERRTEPYVGRLSGLLQNWMDDVGIVSELVWEGRDPQVHVVGDVGNMWDKVKRLLAAHSLEIVAVADQVVVREPLSREATTERLHDVSETVSATDAALAVQVNYLQTRHVTNQEVWPRNTPEEEISIQQVDANETVTWDIPVDASLWSVRQPEHRYMVDPSDPIPPSGVFSVVGNDNLPVQPEQWAAEGGRLRAKVAEEDSRIIRLTIRGGTNENLAPYRIAMSAGGTDYNSLHITGSGIVYDKHAVMLYTGASPETTTEEIGAVVENDYITSREMAYVAGFHTAAALSGNTQTLSGSAYSLEPIGEDISSAGARMYDFDAGTTAETMGEWDTSHEDLAMWEFDELWDSYYLDLFSTQLFGNTVGTKIYHNGQYYRITTTTTSPNDVSFTADSATAMKDFDAVWAEMGDEETSQADEFNETFANMTMGQFSTMPLWQGGQVNDGPHSDA